MEKFDVGLVISKREIEGYEGAYEYWIRTPERKIEKFNLNTSLFDVGNKVRIERQDDNSYKMLGVL